MLRWMAALCVLMVLTGVVASGFFSTEAMGLARTLFGIYAGLLAVSLVIGILRRS